MAIDSVEAIRARLTFEQQQRFDMLYANRAKKNSTAIWLSMPGLGTFGLQQFYLGNPVFGILSILFSWTLIPTFFAFFEAITGNIKHDVAFANIRIAQYLAAHIVSETQKERPIGIITLEQVADAQHLADSFAPVGANAHMCEVATHQDSQESSPSLSTIPLEPAIEATPVAEPTVEVVSVVEPAVETTPVVVPAVEVIPVVEPAVEATPVAEPAVEVVSVIEPVVEATPVAEPAVEVIPVVEPAATMLTSAKIDEIAPDSDGEVIQANEAQNAADATALLESMSEEGFLGLASDTESMPIEVMPSHVPPATPAFSRPLTKHSEESTGTHHIDISPFVPSESAMQVQTNTTWLDVQALHPASAAKQMDFVAPARDFTMMMPGGPTIPDARNGTATTQPIPNGDNAPSDGTSGNVPGGEIGGTSTNIPGGDMGGSGNDPMPPVHNPHGDGPKAD